MSVRVFTARVSGGSIVLDDSVSLPDGTVVTIVADDVDQPVEVTPEEERELLEAIAGIERGETVRAADLFERLRG